WLQLLALNGFEEVLLYRCLQEVFADFILIALQDERHRCLALPESRHACLPLILVAYRRMIRFQRLRINFNADCPLTTIRVHHFNFQWIDLNVLVRPGSENWKREFARLEGSWCERGELNPYPL